MAELDDRYYSLNNQKSENENEQRRLNNEISGIDEKIRRLSDAYKEIGDYKGNLKQIQKNVSRLPGVLDTWKGKQAEDLLGKSDKGGDLYNAYDDYIKAVDGAQDAINWEIYNLKSIRSEKYGFLQGLVDFWNYLCTEIGNYFN